MDPKLASKIVNRLMEKARLVPDTQASLQRRQMIEYEFDALGKTLPVPDAWTVCGANGRSEARIVVDACVITVTLDLSKPQGGDDLIVRSRVLDPRRDRVNLRVGSYRIDECLGQGADLEWAFGDGDDAIRITGFISDAGTDGAQKFARILAARLGWAEPREVED